MSVCAKPRRLISGDEEQQEKGKVKDMGKKMQHARERLAKRKQKAKQKVHGKKERISKGKRSICE